MRAVEQSPEPISPVFANGACLETLFVCRLRIRTRGKPYRSAQCAQTLRSPATATCRRRWINGVNDPDKRVGLYVDEWGTWYDVGKGTNPGYLYQQNTLRDAVLAAVNFNIFHRHADRVRMTSIAQPINVLQSVILTDGNKIALTPTYHAFRMYVPFQDATSLPLDLTTPDFVVDGTSVPAVSASAARGADGKIHVGIANMAPQDSVDLDIDLGGLQVKAVSGEVLTADGMDAHNVPGQPAALAPAPYSGARLVDGRLRLALPARSVVVVRLD